MVFRQNGLLKTLTKFTGKLCPNLFLNNVPA